MLRCDRCGDTVIGDEGNRLIDAWLDHCANIITPEEVQSFLTKYRLTQKEASTITGLGEKNLSRWLTGRARPSVSVSNFLRVLLADESAFELLRQRNFSGRRISASYPSSDRTPDEEEKTVLKQIDYPKLVELQVVRDTRSPQERRTQLCRWARCGDLLEFRRKMETRMESMAAFKDTRQKANPVSAGLWVCLGEEAGRNLETQPYHRDHLREAVKRIRNLTTRPLTETARVVQSELANAGVALVFVPIMKESALRGCTGLVTQNKALIIHGLKYRSLSQFWIILFHEIAHLLLHISDPGQSISDYEEASTDLHEAQADEWAHDTLASRDLELEFLANHPKPQPWDLEHYARQLHVHPAIAAEVLNRRAGEEVISFAFLRKRGLFPQLSESETEALMATSSFSGSSAVPI
jgi:HTH-type transcriptional regulator/antitoxin HigA